MADSLNIAKEIFESDDFDSALRELYTSAWSDSNSAVCYVLSIAPDNGGWFEFAVVADSAMVRGGDPKRRARSRLSCAFRRRGMTHATHAR